MTADIRLHRRRLVLGLAAVAAAPPLRGQVGKGVPRIGIAFNSNAESASPFRDVFVEGMEGQGLRVDRDYALELRYAQGRNDRYPALMAELLAAQVDLIVAASNTAAGAAKAATSTLPIVMAGTLDPDATGLVASLARPGGNVTGVANFSALSGAKRLELLRETLPGASRVALLVDPKAGGYPRGLREVEDAAKAWRLQTTRAEASTEEELLARLAALPAWHPHALLAGQAVLYWTYRRRVIEFCAEQRLPAIYAYKDAVVDGGLMSYAPSLAEGFRKAAWYVVRILKGARPADLPVEQPMRFELVVNLRTADALGLAIPKSILVRADETIR